MNTGQGYRHYTGWLQPCNLKGKATPLQAWSSPCGFSRLTLSEFLDNRHMKVVRLSDLWTGCLYLSGETPGTHFCYSLNRTQGHWSMRNRNALLGIRPATFWFVVQCLNQLVHNIPQPCNVLHPNTCIQILKNHSLDYLIEEKKKCSAFFYPQLLTFFTSCISQYFTMCSIKWCNGY